MSREDRTADEALALCIAVAEADFHKSHRQLTGTSSPIPDEEVHQAIVAFMRAGRRGDRPLLEDDVELNRLGFMRGAFEVLAHRVRNRQERWPLPDDAPTRWRAIAWLEARSEELKEQERTLAGRLLSTP